MDRKLTDLIKLLFSILFFLSFSKIVFLIFNLCGMDLSSLSMFGKSIYQFVMSILILVVLICIYYKDIKEDFLKFRKNINNNIKNIFKLFLLFILVKFGVSFLSSIIMIVLKMDVNSLTSANQNMIESLVKSAPVLMFITSGFVGPFYEEVLFRLGFKKVFTNKILFILLSGFIFGLMHIFPLSEGVSLILGLIQSISYVSMGIFLAYIYQKTDNIFVNVGIHFFNNIISLLAMISLM